MLHKREYSVNLIEPVIAEAYGSQDGQRKTWEDNVRKWVTPGVWQVPEGSGEQRQWRKLVARSYDDPMTLMVKGFMVMMMMMMMTMVVVVMMMIVLKRSSCEDATSAIYGLRMRIY